MSLAMEDNTEVRMGRNKVTKLMKDAYDGNLEAVIEAVRKDLTNNKDQRLLQGQFLPCNRSYIT